MVVAHGFDPGRQIFEWEGNLVYRVSFRIVRTAQRNPRVEKPRHKAKQRKAESEARASGQVSGLFVCFCFVLFCFNESVKS